MVEIKPAEVSAILLQELAGYHNVAELEEIGTVLQIGDGIARIYGLNNVESGELIGGYLDPAELSKYMADAKVPKK